LVIKASEGFVTKDILQVSGTAQHLGESSHEPHNSNLGAPLGFLFNLNLNNPSIAGQISSDAQISLNSALSDGHHGPHKNLLTKPTLSANFFDKNTEIGLVNLDIRPRHVSDAETSLLMLGSILALLTT
jgi:hypothetical protein